MNDARNTTKKRNKFWKWKKNNARPEIVNKFCVLTFSVVFFRQFVELFESNKLDEHGSPKIHFSTEIW